MNCPLCYLGLDSDKTENKVLFGTFGDTCALSGALGQTCYGFVKRRRR